jgi:hypothetical protein
MCCKTEVKYFFIYMYVFIAPRNRKLDSAAAAEAGSEPGIEDRSDPEGDNNDVQNTEFSSSDSGQINSAYSTDRVDTPHVSSDDVGGRASMLNEIDTRVSVHNDNDSESQESVTESATADTTVSGESRPTGTVIVDADTDYETEDIVNTAVSNLASDVPVREKVTPAKPPRGVRRDTQEEEEENIVTQDKPRSNTQEVVM